MDYKPDTKYCPMNDGDDCLRCPDCNERVKDEPAERLSPASRVLEIAQRIRAVQAARAEPQKAPVIVK
jgi:hypothetical protein